MARTIQKFPLAVQTTQNVQIPIGAEPKSVAMQNGAPTLFCLVNPAKAKRARTIAMFATDANIPEQVFERGQYVGTVVQDATNAWHVFFEVWS